MDLHLLNPFGCFLKAGAIDNKYGEFVTYFIILIGMPIFCYIVFAVRWHISNAGLGTTEDTYS